MLLLLPKDQTFIFYLFNVLVQSHMPCIHAAVSMLLCTFTHAGALIGLYIIIFLLHFRGPFPAYFLHITSMGGVALDTNLHKSAFNCTSFKKTFSLE